MHYRQIVVSVMFLIVFSLNVYAEETWKIASLDWQPYSGGELANQGNSIQKLKEVLKKKNINLIVEFYPWKRAQKKAATAEFVGYFPAWPEEVTSGFKASPAVDWSVLSVMTRKGETIKYKDIDELFKKYKVGIISTYVYPENIDKAAKKYAANVDGSPSETALIKKLSKNRIQVAITDPNVMLYLAEKEGIDNIVVNTDLMKKELVIAFRDGPDNKKRMEDLNTLLNSK